MTAAGFCSAASRFAAAGSEQLCASEASNIEIVFGLICRFSTVSYTHLTLPTKRIV